ncbi:type I secretion system permease/ATPase [Sphingomonas suaedae]|uniref:type I secretion system permease/ATPase n=1 Tax=Sphingomonas suaedae TaxID=2599297 RepID=UPI0016467F26|nr:type I secretion system permease/ATPase [Sphingomonas suaedae]
MRVIEASALRAALGELRHGLIGVAGLSAGINLLTLTGSIYMLVVYDRVLPGRSLPTLISVFLIAAIAFAFLGAFDVLRARMLGDVAASLDRDLGVRAQEAELRLALEKPQQFEQASPVRDLDQIRGFIAGPGPAAIIDLPWIVVFIVILALVHPWLGIVTFVGGLVAAALAWTAERVGRGHVAALAQAASRRRAIGARRVRHAELISVLGMRAPTRTQWETEHQAMLHQQTQLTASSTILSGISRIFRMFLQSAVLTVGAILVIEGKATGGVIIASSILSARALAPVDQAIANWRGFVAMRESWAQLSRSIALTPEAAVDRTALPPPRATLSVERVALVPPGSDRVVVNDAALRANAGQLLGIVGPSGSGKSALVRAIVGAWRPARGTIRLDGAALDQWDSEALGRHIGYLPQSVELFAGTVAANIARFREDATSEGIVAAAQAAGSHELILQLPQGYETQVGEDGRNLSAGQRQRIGLARALFGDPFLVVLDEPNSNLDMEGDAALVEAVTAVRARGGIAVVVAHRAAILDQADLLLVMRSGGVQAFGPRAEVIDRLRPVAPLRERSV